MEKEKFLGRYFDHRDMTWRYKDGSGGAIPDECRKEVEIVKTCAEVYGIKGMWLWAFSTIQRYKKFHNIK